MSDQIYYHSFLNRDRMIHIVDADPATCEALSVLFRLEGFQTTFSLEAGHFIVSLERRRPDIVVLNLAVGEESGLTLLRRVKAMRTGTPVFMLSDEPQVEAAVTAMKLGASDVISKPIDTEHLLTVIRDALRRDIHLGAMQGGRRPVEVRGFAQLFHHPGPVHFDRAGGDAQLAAGFLVGLAVGDELQHFAFARGELGEATHLHRAAAALHGP